MIITIMEAIPFGLELFCTFCGVFLTCLIILVPGMHIYNIAGLILLLASNAVLTLTPECLTYLFLGMVSSYAVLNTIPSVFLSIPDESTVFIIQPAQKYMLQRRGYEAVVLTGIGGLGGLVILTSFSIVAAQILPPLRQILSPHLGWILIAVILYLGISGTSDNIASSEMNRMCGITHCLPSSKTNSP
jgi:putative membrane protein